MTRNRSLLTAFLVAGTLVALTAATARQGSLRDNFQGGLPALLDSDDLSTVRVHLDAGARANWHSHAGGQLLLVEEGRLRIQLRGQPMRELHAGEPVYTPPGVEHWHGAAPDQDLTMLSVSAGGVEWLEPLSDDDYFAAPVR